MPDVIKVRIGGVDYEAPLIMNFATLERVGPAMDAIAECTLYRPQVSALCAFYAELFAKTHPELTLPVIKDRLRINVADGSDERMGLVEAYDAILIASGYAKTKASEPGEANPPETPAAA
jgi:hypothetical protein